MAHTFRFRLDSVLNLRSQESQQAQAALGEASSALVARQEDLALRRQYRQQLLEHQAGAALSVRDIEAHWYHVRSVNKEIETMERECLNLREIEDNRREELSEALKKQRSLEKLRERKHDLFRENLRKEEQKQMDEIAQRGKADAAAH